MDIFYLKNRDKKGKPFGFVRYSVKLDVNEVLEKLNNIWIGSYKIRVFIPKFSRKEIKNQKLIVRRQPFSTDGGLRKPDNSYADAVSGRKENPEVVKPKVEEVLNFKVDNKDIQWAKNCYTWM
ncbi:hypothetical protein ACS0TY_012879 [Phlomoides rotata]